MALIQVIRFDGLKSRDWLIYKYPMEDIVYGSQLIVQEGQTAIFVKGGVVADTFVPGTYTLATDNLPLLKGLVNLPFGRRTPFSAELYFVNNTALMELCWGTTAPIQLIDPKYHVKLRIRAYGQMGLRIFDPVLFFRSAIGGMQPGDLVRMEKLKEYYRGLMIHKISAAIANEIINNQISALEIATKLDTLSSHILEKIHPEFEAFGLNVINFFIQSINFPDEDFAQINSILEDRAAFELMGDARYATKRTFDIYEQAASNENGMAGVLASGGLGVGAGAGIANAFSSSANVLSTKTCSSCHKPISINARFCPHCGNKTSARYCSCGAEIGAVARFCHACGKKVDES